LPNFDQQFENEEYLAKCLRDYMNDDFEIEQVLYLFSYMINHDIAKTFTTRIRDTAQHFINVDWIDQYGKILINSDEARRLAEEAQTEIDRERRNCSG